MTADLSAVAMPEPAQVYQDYLDITSPQVLAGDAEAVAARIQRPFVMTTAAGQAVSETMEELRSDIATFSDTLRAQGVTHYIRLVWKAHYVSEQLIEGWHTSYILRNATSIVPPYRSRMLLRRDEIGIWRAAEAEHEVANQRMPMHLPLPAPGCHAIRWSAPMARIRAEHARAEPIYQVFLDSLDRATEEGDFDDWHAHFAFPHMLHLEDEDRVFATPEECRTVFDVQRASIATSGVTMRRQVKFAEFMGDDRIVGYHDTVWRDQAHRVTCGPVAGRMVLIHDAGTWRANDTTNALPGAVLGDGATMPSGPLPTFRQIQKRMTQ